MLTGLWLCNSLSVERKNGMKGGSVTQQSDSAVFAGKGDIVIAWGKN